MNNLKQIDLMTRDSLINLGIKLKIKGHNNFFSKPYVKKDTLKNIILREIKHLKKIQRSKSLSSLCNNTNNSNNPNNSNNSNNSNNPNNSNNTNNISNTEVDLSNNRRSKSLQRKKSHKINYSSINDITQIYNIDRCVYPKVKKLVAIGDIHGDLSVAIKALKLAGVIDNSILDNSRDINNIKWTGDDTYVVQLGDQIDRVRPSKLYNNLCSEDDEDLYKDEGSDLKIISLFEKLHKEAKQQGGALFSIFGNHELMNVDGDFRYVSPKEFNEFGNFFSGTYEQNSSFPYGYNERLNAFKPGGSIAKRLAQTRYSVIQVGSWVFVHGGISPKCAEKYSLEDINKYIKVWLMGKMTDNTHLNYLYHSDDEDDSPFWSRIYSDMDEWDEHESTKSFNQTINNLNIKNIKDSSNIIKGMIMGHSPQFMYNRGINSSNDNKVWRVDVGASKAFGELGGSEECKLRKVQVLVIDDDEKFHIVKEKC